MKFRSVWFSFVCASALGCGHAWRMPAGTDEHVSLDRRDTGSGVTVNMAPDDAGGPLLASSAESVSLAVLSASSVSSSGVGRPPAVSASAVRPLGRRDFREFLSDAMAHAPRTMRPTYAPFRGSGTLAILARAKSQLLASPELKRLWMGEELARALKRIGSDIPILSGPRIPDALFLAYSEREQTLFVWPDAVRVQLPDMRLYLLHAATVIAVHERVRELTGLTTDEYAAALGACRDLKFGFAFASEGLAFRNEAFWGMSKHDQPSVFSGSETIVRRIVETERGTVEDRRELAQDIAAHVKYLFRQIDHEPVATAECGSLTALRGAHEGAHIVPSDIDSDYAFSLIQALEASRRQRVSDISPFNP